MKHEPPLSLPTGEREGHAAERWGSCGWKIPPSGVASHMLETGKKTVMQERKRFLYLVGSGDKLKLYGCCICLSGPVWGTFLPSIKCVQGGDLSSSLIILSLANRLITVVSREG